MNMQDNNAYQAPKTMSHPEAKRKPEKPSGFTWTELVVVLAIIGVLIAMLLPAMQSSRGPHHRTRCLNNLRQISLATLNYESVNGHLPPVYLADETGKPIHSWRVLLLPYLEHQELYDQYSFDEPWDGPNNSKLHDVIMAAYQCPSAGSRQPGHCSNYMAITGKGTAFDGDHKTTYAEVADGVSSTLTYIEVPNSNTHWMEPVDLPLDVALTRLTDPAKSKACCNHPGGINVALMDASTHSIDFPVSAEVLRALVEINDGATVDVCDL